jgi:hypothetical protein
MIAQWQLDRIEGDVPGVVHRIAQLTSPPA